MSKLDKTSLQHVVVCIFGLCATFLVAIDKLSTEMWYGIAMLILGYSLKNGYHEVNGRKKTLEVSGDNMNLRKESS